MNRRASSYIRIEGDKAYGHKAKVLLIGGRKIGSKRIRTKSEGGKAMGAGRVEEVAKKPGARRAGEVVGYSKNILFGLDYPRLL